LSKVDFLAPLGRCLYRQSARILANQGLQKFKDH